MHRDAAVDPVRWPWKSPLAIPLPSAAPTPAISPASLLSPCLTNRLSLGDAPFFAPGNEPPLLAHGLEDPCLDYLLAPPSQHVLLRFTYSQTDRQNQHLLSRVHGHRLSTPADNTRTRFVWSPQHPRLEQPSPLHTQSSVEAQYHGTPSEHLPLHRRSTRTPGRPLGSLHAVRLLPPHPLESGNYG